MLSLRLPTWLLVSAAILVAFPCGWAVGVIVALMAAGSNVGQLPAFTIPLGIVASLLFAVAPILTPSIRLAIMLAIVALFMVAGMILVG